MAYLCPCMQQDPDSMQAWLISGTSITQSTDFNNAEGDCWPEICHIKIDNRARQRPRILWWVSNISDSTYLDDFSANNSQETQHHAGQSTRLDGIQSAILNI